MTIKGLYFWSLWPKVLGRWIGQFAVNLSNVPLSIPVPQWPTTDLS